MQSDLFFVLGIILLFNPKSFLLGLGLLIFATYIKMSKTKKHDDITF